jgi:hypothetical protein
MASFSRMKEMVVEVALGVRHRRSFHVPEIVGSVVDHIINDNASPFHKTIYNRTDALMDGFENRGRVLISRDEASTLAIDIDSVVFDTKCDNLAKTIDEIKETHIPYLAKNVFARFKIENINRLGIVFTFLEKDTSRLDKLIGGSLPTSLRNPITWCCGSRKEALRQQVLSRRTFRTIQIPL